MDKDSFVFRVVEWFLGMPSVVAQLILIMFAGMFFIVGVYTALFAQLFRKSQVDVQ